MTEKEYRQHPAISRSELWHIRESPQKFKYYKENPPEPTPSLLFGQVFHKILLEPDTFCEEFVVAPEVNRRTKEGKQIWESFVSEHENQTIIQAEMFALAKEMCEAVNREPLAVKLLNGAAEVPFFWTDEMTGEDCKCRVDVLNTAYSQPIIVDVKTTADASTDSFIRSAINYGYDFQAAMYFNGVAKNIGKKPLFVFIAVEKEPPYAVNILQADELMLQRGYDLFREYIGIYHDCKVSGNWYGYLGRLNQINNLALPSYLAKEVQ